MAQNELSIWDLVIVGVYLVSMVLIGVISVKRVKNTGDYFVATRSFGPFILMATVCATIIGACGLMGRAGVAYSSGFKAVITAVPYLIGMFVFSGIAGRISDLGIKFGISSIPELMESRFGKSSKIFMAAFIAINMMGTVAAQITATATVINMLGSNIGLNYEAGALIATLVFMVYTATSGLFGVVYTDVFQFYMLLLFVYILIPISSLIRIGGFHNFVVNLDPALVKPRVDGQIIGDIITYLVSTVAGAEMWQ